jgi:hypothetical protein
MSVIADELHITIVTVVFRHYLSYRISTYSAGAAGGVPVRMYAIVVPRMAITDRNSTGDQEGSGTAYPILRTDVDSD